MSLDVIPDPHALGVLRLQGALDIATVDELRRAGQQALDDGATTLVVDATDLDFSDSTGLGCLVMLHKRAAEQGGTLELRGVNTRFARLLDIVGLDKVFVVTASDRP